MIWNHFRLEIDFKNLAPPAPVDRLPQEDGTLLITTRVSRSVSDQIPLDDFHENYRTTLAHPVLHVPPAGAAEDH